MQVWSAGQFDYEKKCSEDDSGDDHKIEKEAFIIQSAYKHAFVLFLLKIWN